MDDYDVEIALSLMKLLRQAEKKDVSLELRRQTESYDNGKPLPRGWTISINYERYTDHNGEERVYQSLVGAIAAGFMLLEDT